MQRRLARLAYSFLTAALLHAAACGGDSGSDPASFAKASDIQKQRALAAGLGGDAMFGMVTASFLGLIPPESTCPRVTAAGNKLTATFGCTDDDGTRLDGSIVAVNVPSFLGGGNDPSQPIVVTFDGYRSSGGPPEDAFAFDGTITTRPDGAMEVALTVSLGGLEVATDATFRTGDRTTADAGSTIDLTGLGSAEIKGAWDADDENPAGALELHGADVLKIDFDRVVDFCAPLTVDGAPAGQICNPPDEE